MKKLAAILLLGVLFFNWYGYQLISSWLEQRADRQLEASLDLDRYDESQLLTVKVSAARLAYYNTSTQFERADGQIEVGGVQYKYVSRRIFNDSLELRCIPNQTAMRLQKDRNDFFKLVNDLQQHSNSGKKGDSHSLSKSASASDYCMTTLFSMAVNLSYIDLPSSAYPAPGLSTSYNSIVEQPPDVRSLLC